MTDLLTHTTGLILHFRTPEKTLKCIHSLISEGLLSIILVDNSEDGGKSLTSMKAQLKIYELQGVKIHTLSNGLNQGFSQGANLGFLLAKKHKFYYLLLINSDAYFQKGGIREMLRSMTDASLCLPMTRPSNSDKLESLFGFYHISTALHFKTPQKNCLKYPSGCCLLIKVDHFTPPLFDDDLFFYGEDVVLGKKIKELNLSAVECNEAIITHEGAGSAKKGSVFYEYHINRWHWLMPKKLSRKMHSRLFYTFVRCITLPSRCLIRCCRYQSLIPLYGLALASLDIIRKRRRTLTPPINDN